MRTIKEEFLPKEIELKAKDICDSMGITLVESPPFSRSHQIEVFWGNDPQDFLYIDRKVGFSRGELQVVINPKLNASLSEALCKIHGVNSPKNTESGKLILSSQYKGFKNYFRNSQHQGAAWRIELTSDMQPFRQFLSLISSEETADSSIKSDATPHEKEFTEGAQHSVVLSRFERSTSARHACIEHYGCKCELCGYDFEENFGEIGKGFIHVHHVVPLESIKASYKVNPITDLVPLCPNCHAMAHRRKPPFSLRELQNMREQKL